MLTKTLQSIPSPIRVFLARAVTLFVGWQLLYQLLLAPPRKLDGWLTLRTARATAALISRIYEPATAIVQDLYAIVVMNNKQLIRIADGCNGLDLFVLNIGFLVCFPGQRLRKILLFAFAGMAGIFVLNVLRCVALTWLHIHQPQWTDIAHHYIFTAIVYGAIFWSWTLYVRNARMDKYS